jgi:hypothetical protein
VLLKTFKKQQQDKILELTPLLPVYKRKQNDETQKPQSKAQSTKAEYRARPSNEKTPLSRCTKKKKTKNQNQNLQAQNFENTTCSGWRQ